MSLANTQFPKGPKNIDNLSFSMKHSPQTGQRPSHEKIGLSSVSAPSTFQVFQAQISEVQGKHGSKSSDDSKPLGNPPSSLWHQVLLPVGILAGTKMLMGGLVMGNISKFLYKTPGHFSVKLEVLGGLLESLVVGGILLFNRSRQQANAGTGKSQPQPTEITARAMAFLSGTVTLTNTLICSTLNLIKSQRFEKTVASSVEEKLPSLISKLLPKVGLMLAGIGMTFVVGYCEGYLSQKASKRLHLSDSPH
ncbi:MAG: hypothetical protein K2X66_04320 [Cyanobacteria bacterium]|nr:hypothetical protein [Cyanobacteriota bacterium]